MAKLKTEKGLFWLTISGVLLLLFSSIPLLMFSPSTLARWMSPHFTWFWLLVLLSIGSRSGFVTFIFGLYYCYQGRSEFGKKHTRYIRIGMWLVVISICAILLVVPMFFILILSYRFAFLFFHILSIFFLAFMTLGYLALPLGIVLSLKGLVIEKNKISLWVGFALLEGYFIWTFIETYLNMDMGHSLAKILRISFICVQAIGYLLLTVVCFTTYKDIKSGKIQTRKTRKRKMETPRL
jgi:hypothetical protein